MRSTWALTILLVACGDNGGDNPKPDARPPIDAAPDAPVPLTCGHTEAMDATNDTYFDMRPSAVPEPTGLTFAGAIKICGNLDSGHFDNVRMLIDVDTYSFTVAGPGGGGAIVYITAPGAEATNSLLIEIYSAQTLSQVGKFMGTFAMASDVLMPGEYFITVQSNNGTAPLASIPYEIVVKPDNAQARCPKSTAAATYTEALDMATEDGNDVYLVNYQSVPRRNFTANGADVVEPTGIMATPGMSYRVTGTNRTPTATPASWVDSYMDRDTYQVTMDGTTNQLSLRLNWPGTTMDMDVLVFPMGQLNDFADGYLSSNTEDEFITFAVLPGMSYWLFVGANDGSTGQPVTYDLTVCGDAFTPLP